MGGVTPPGLSSGPPSGSVWIQTHPLTSGSSAPTCAEWEKVGPTSGLCEGPRGHSHQPMGQDSHALAPEGRAEGRTRVEGSQQTETPSLEGEKENVNSPGVTHNFIIQSTTTTGPHA